MKKEISVIMIAMSVCFVSCQTDNNVAVLPDQPNEPEVVTPTLPDIFGQADIQLTPMEQTILQSNNAFAFRLLNTVVKNGKGDENILLSPLSASLALAMLNNGAYGVTQDEIRKALGYGNCTQEEMNVFFQKMISGMKAVDVSVAFESANSIWVKQEFPVLAPFTEVNQTYYDAQIQNIAFNSAALDLINGWCAEKTHDNIKGILDVINADAVMYLLNAIYFKGAWTYPFNESVTQDALFYNQDGPAKMVPTMRNAEDFNYAKNDSFEIVELPYGDRKFSLAFILPAQGISLTSILEGLNIPSWENTLAQMHISPLNLSLPRFKVADDQRLNENLKALGMQSMFSEHANFSLIHPTAPLSVSLVRQKTSLSVDESGSEASAVTIIEVLTTSTFEPTTPPVRIDVKIDHPFIYLIKERSTGSISFIGVIRNL
jgi:serpin B